MSFLLPFVAALVPAIPIPCMTYGHEDHNAGQCDNGFDPYREPLKITHNRYCFHDLEDIRIRMNQPLVNPCGHTTTQHITTNTDCIEQEFVS